MKFIIACMMILAFSTFVAVATRRRAPFRNCPSSKSNSGLVMTKPARSRIECSVICLNNPDCLSASFCKMSDDYICQLSRFYVGGSCSGLATSGSCTQTVVANPCENGGTFSPQNRTCHCAKGFHGDYCHRHARDCMETSLENEIYTIQPIGSEKSFQWVCCIPAVNYTVLSLFYSSFTMNFNQSWKEARHGILPDMPPTGYFVIGLELMHQLTKQGKYDLFLRFHPKNKSYGKVWYRNFRVATESDGYALYWDIFETEFQDYLDGFGGAGDTTKNLNGQRFGTHDKDINGCAHAKNASWWYNPSGCTSLIFEPNGISWPTNRSGIVNTEYIKAIIAGFMPVHWYVNDDLVLE